MSPVVAVRMNISSVGSSDSNLPVYQTRSRASVPQNNSSVENSRTSSIRAQDPAVTNKLESLTRVQQAFVAAMRTGEAIESQGLLSVIH
jgi:hypothetical protein